MSRQLPSDCLNEIFEYLEEEIAALHSCLLVNRLWCEVCVRILWRNVWGFSYNMYYRSHVPSSILRTLIACLPYESKGLLSRNEISISTPTSNPPIFNYTSYFKVLSIYRINYIIKFVLEKKYATAPQNIQFKKYIVLQEILKMCVIQISSLNVLDYTFQNTENVLNLPNIPLAHFPGIMDCFKNLTELRCNSNNFSEIFYHLSQICNHIRSLDIEFKDVISNGLTNFISSINNLKHLKLSQSDGVDWKYVIHSLRKHSNTLTALHLFSHTHTTISFVESFSNLQELNISSFQETYLDFKKLQDATFPNLEILKLPYAAPEVEHLIKFLEKNGKSLKEFHANRCDNLSVARFCPNLKKLSVNFDFHEMDALKTVFSSCQHLESIKINEKEMLEIVAKHSPKNLHELRIHHDARLGSKDLETFFKSWKTRSPFKSLSFIIIKIKGDFSHNGFETNEKNMRVIKKYRTSGVIKSFEIELE